MKKENKEFLDSNRHFYEQMLRADTLSGLGHQTKTEMERVMRDEFNPGYTADLNCATCIFEMVKRLYHNYDRWLSDNPIKVAANFPSHKSF